jgi:hypothetical protein
MPHILRIPPPLSTMGSASEGRDAVLPTLDVFIQVLTLVKDACGVPPAQVTFGAASSLLTMIRVRFPLQCEDESPDPRLSRTRWLTIKISSTLGGLAAMYANHFTGD